METASERWASMHQARKQQMDVAYAQLGRTSADFWDRRARRFHSTTSNVIAHDPLFLRLKHEVTLQDSVLDVGAGTGRFTIALAPQAKHITAVEPNAAMLAYLQRDAAELQLDNITTVPMNWQDAPTTLSASVVICSHVLYPIEDIVPFLAKLLASTERICYIYMRATQIDEVLGDLWRHFHGTERFLSPSYIHALDVLYEMGLYASVEVVDLPVVLNYPTLEIATDELLEQLILPDDAATRAELLGLLEHWLIKRNEMFVPPIDKMVGAILSLKV